MRSTSNCVGCWTLLATTSLLGPASTTSPRLFAAESAQISAGPAKRGLVGGTCGQTQLFGPLARHWQYNYGINRTIFEGGAGWNLTDPSCAALAADPSFEFVPMVSSLEALTKYGAAGVVQPGSARLLGVNEPSDSKHESAALLAARWPEYEKIAARFDPPLLLGSPAPGGLRLARGQQWLRDFFGNCSALHGAGGCRVDFVAVHFYECDGSTDATAAASAASMMQFLDDAYASFRLPLWLTEFNCGDGASPQPYANQSAANHLRFLKAALPRLEAAPHVARYAWFQTWQRNSPLRPGHNPGCSLTNHDGTALSSLGEFYNSYSYEVRGSSGDTGSGAGRATLPPAVLRVPVGASAGDVRAAVASACGALRSGRATDATVLFAPGVHELDLGGGSGGGGGNGGGNGSALLRVTGCVPPPGGRLTIAGAGMDSTRLVVATHGHNVLEGEGAWARLTVRDLTFARPAPTTTQGRVLAVNATHVTLSVAAGFPPVGALFRGRKGRLHPEQGLYLRRFAVPAPGAPPRLVTDARNGTAWPPVLNAQVHFKCGGDGEMCPDVQRLPVPPGSRAGSAGAGAGASAAAAAGTGASASGGVWRLRVMWPAGERERYAASARDPSQLVAVKVKHGGQAYYLRDGDDLAFLRVRWLAHSRGVVIATPNVVLRDTRVERGRGSGAAAGVAALATPGGGPQITAGTGAAGHHAPIANVTIANHTSVATGDDALGLFGIASGSVTGCDVRDSFARGILLSNCSDAFVANVRGNRVVRCPVYVC